MHGHPWLNRLSFFLFILVLFFAPLAFGTTELWSMATVELLIVVSALLFFLSRQSQNTALYGVPGILPLCFFLIWMYLQCIPLPPQLVQVISPHMLAIYQPILDSQQTSPWIPLTVDRKATLLECMRISSYALFYILTVQLLSHADRLKKTVHAVAILATTIAFLALLQHFTSPQKIYWFRQVTSSPWGPWVYRNHYAGFMVMIVPLVLALFSYYLTDIEGKTTLREKLVSFFSMPGSNVQLVFGFGTILILSSIFFSLSRGGILSAILTLSLFFIILNNREKQPTTIKLVVLFFGIFFFITQFNWEPIFARLGAKFSQSEGRFLIWQDSLHIVRDFFFTGSGAGTFVDIFPNYKTITDNLVYEHAHNDYLELLTDTGVIGFVLMAWFVISILKTCFQQIFARHDHFFILISTGAFCGITGLLLYSFMDFNMQNGANGLYFFFLCGLLVAACYTRQYFRTHPSLLVQISSQKTKKTIVAVVSVFLIFLLRVQGGTIWAGTLFNRANDIAATFMPHPEIQMQRISLLLNRAKRYDPFSGKYPYALGNVKKYQLKDHDALALYLEAALKEPMQGEFLQAAGRLLAKTNPNEARNLLETGYKRARQKNIARELLVEFLVSQGEKKEALHILQGSLQRSPQLLHTVYPLLVRSSFSRNEIIAVLPKQASSWITFAQLAESKKDYDDSDYFMDQAFNFLDQETTITPQLFMAVYSHYHKKKNDKKAIKALKKGITFLPDYVRFHLLLGNYYLREKKFLDAQKAYEQALLIEPENKEAENRLRQLHDRQ